MVKGNPIAWCHWYSSDFAYKLCLFETAYYLVKNFENHALSTGEISSAGSILTEIEKSTILKQFFRIEIELKSISINLQNRQKTEIGKSSLFLHQI